MNRPPCFADLNQVFPLGADGLRHTPRACMICVFKTECLKEAMESGQGVSVKEEALDRAYSAGVIGFFERWSRKKNLHRMRSQAPGGKKKAWKGDSSRSKEEP